jgi:hypothetical protein
MQGTSASWSPKRKTHPQRKRPHKGELGLQTSWRTDNNFFWLGGRLFNTASPRLGTPTQRKARRQDGHPNTTQGTYARRAPKRNARHVRKMGAQTKKRSATKNIHTREHYAKRRAGGWIRINFGLEVDYLIWPHQGLSPKRNAGQVRKLGTPTQRKARPQAGRPNARPQRKLNSRP